MARNFLKLAATAALAAMMAASATAQSLIRDAEIETTLREWTDPILEVAGLNPSDVDLYIINDPSLNAFVANGQKIHLHTGLLIAAAFLIVGMFIDAIPAIIILGTVLFPLAQAAGMHPIHFAIIGVVSLAFGLVTPPYGLCLLIAASIGNINDGTENIYVDNTGDDYNTEMDGFTVTMTLTMFVNPGEVNDIRIGIADVGDSSYDSNLLIAGDSIQTDLVALTDTTHVAADGSKTIDVLANDANNGGGVLTITHVNGVAVTSGSIVTLATGQQIEVNADGTLTLHGDGDVEDFNFTYTVSNGDDSDTGFVNASSIPCFVAGTLIRTPEGERPVESLEPGDLVMTRDEGAMPLRWIGSRRVAAEGDFAPILIQADALGKHRNLLVSPQHRILLRDAYAELLFGEGEVLAAAKDLVNGFSITRRPGGMVTYVHLLFDRHQVIYSEGLATESFLPGPQTASLFERPVMREIYALFPELDPETGLGYGGAARPALKSYEGQLLAAMTAA